MKKLGSWFHNFLLLFSDIVLLVLASEGNSGLDSVDCGNIPSLLELPVQFYLRLINRPVSSYSVELLLVIKLAGHTESLGWTLS